ncbi:Uncharacterised protein [Chryseobacterium taihuense]|uniref:Uncharacterized protein n=1 Tax=Chryseobacterium taihuense TaxID=1141221 RepID=A0A4U8WAC2_9FLAO|nr:Uncharacterised protein [Chryseobacterium taihuense]
MLVLYIFLICNNLIGITSEKYYYDKETPKKIKIFGVLNLLFYPSTIFSTGCSGLNIDTISFCKCSNLYVFSKFVLAVWSPFG